VTSNEARERFDAAYDGNLRGEDRAAFDAALAADEALREEYDELCALLDEANRDEPAAPEAEPELLHGVQSRLRARSRGRFYRDRFAERAGPRAFAPLVIAAVMLLVVGIAWLSLYYVQVEGPTTYETASPDQP
jgi:hypothetical protein